MILVNVSYLYPLKTLEAFSGDIDRNGILAWNELKFIKIFRDYEMESGSVS